MCSLPSETVGDEDRKSDDLLGSAVSSLSPYDAAGQAYFNAFWSIHDLEVLFHHFCSPAPWRREEAPAYGQTLQRLQSYGLMSGTDVTADGAWLIARICDVKPQGSVAAGPTSHTEEVNT